ncbi:hypothetical protein VNO78_07853 [Psophocarpus tetragonolobus]|uniref:Flavin-containing monooxygenase n=1 Tax=Psophocarpus tetragonolobus TaxID=3891 RepID=A0AAN9T3Z6_PSOTE
MWSTVPIVTAQQVAVIGAGAAGLVAARELRREGHDVVVFEQGKQVGGTWVYSGEVESDLLGLDPKRSIVHSSLYASLRTNLPRECMGFRDYPFRKKEGKKGRDGRRFPLHTEVLMYLQDFAAHFEIAQLVRFQTEVVFVRFAQPGKWKVTSTSPHTLPVDDIYDAVIVCNGHFVLPRLAHIPANVHSSESRRKCANAMASLLQPRLALLHQDQDVREGLRIAHSSGSARLLGGGKDGDVISRAEAALVKVCVGQEAKRVEWKFSKNIKQMEGIERKVGSVKGKKMTIPKPGRSVHFCLFSEEITLALVIQTFFSCYKKGKEI